jgi:hypothetical protein
MLEKQLKKNGKKAKPAQIHNLEADQEDDRRPLRSED